MLAFVRVLLLFILPVAIFAQSGVLSKIVDGDTIYFGYGNEQVKCRLAYIDTPESRYNNKLKRDLAGSRISTKAMLSAGKSATRALKSLINIGETYTYSISGKDRYKRSICLVSLSKNTLLNDMMISKGYAVPFRRYIKHSKLYHYNSLLKDAKNRRSGLWGSHFKVMKHLDTFHR